MDIQLFSVLLHLSPLLKHQIDPQPTEAIHCFGGNVTVQSMIEENDIVAERVSLLADEDVARMGIAVHKAMLEYHCRENLKKITRNIRRVYLLVDYLLFLVNFAARYKLHH